MRPPISRLFTRMLVLLTASCAFAYAEAAAEAKAAPDPQQTYVIPFSGAIYITTPAQGSPAVPAQCPGNAPVSCSSIGQPNYCCPSGNYCGYGNSQVGCCPTGQTCNGWAGGGSGAGATGWTSSYWQPTQTYCPAGGGGYYNGGAGLCQSPTPVATVYVQSSYYNGGGGGGGGYYAGATTTVYTGNSGQGQGQYCSTLYAQGPGLPTVRSGQCGQILVLAANGESATLKICWGLLMATLGAHLVWRR